MKIQLPILRTAMLPIAVLACLLFSQAGEYKIELVIGYWLFTDWII